MKLIIDDGGRAAAGHTGPANDCVCRAVAIATERPYQEIYDRLKAMIIAKFGSKRPRGVEAQMHGKLMEDLGWVWVPVNKERLREDELPSGRIVVCIREHATAVVDGEIHDTFDCSKWGTMRIRGYYKKDADTRDTMSKDRKRLLDAVTKILALADSTNHKAEAATARAKAAEIMAKYDIAIGSSEALDGLKVEGEMRGRTPMPYYEFYLLAAIGTFCGVLVLRRGADYVFAGKPQDLIAFRYMREVTSAQQDRAWKDYLSANPGRGRESVSWKYGFAKSVRDKVDALMLAATVQQKAMRQDLALVPRHKQAEAEFECLFGKLGGASYGYGGDDNAAGRAAGKSVTLGKGVAAQGPVRQITRQLQTARHD